MLRTANYRHVLRQIFILSILLLSMHFFMNWCLKTDCAAELSICLSICVSISLWPRRPQMQMLQMEPQATAAHTQHMLLPSASAANDASAERSANERDSALERENARRCRRASERSAIWIVTQTDARVLLSLHVLLGALDIFMRSPPPSSALSEETSRCWRAGAVAWSAMFSDFAISDSLGNRTISSGVWKKKNKGGKKRTSWCFVFGFAGTEPCKQQTECVKNKHVYNGNRVSLVSAVCMSNEP